MRKLKPVELALLAGAAYILSASAHADTESCSTVGGTPIGCTYTPTGGGSLPPSINVGSGSGGSSSGGGNSSVTPASSTVLAPINAQAVTVKCLIMAQTNYSNTEYGAILFHNANGDIEIGKLGTGTYNQDNIPGVDINGNPIPSAKAIAIVHNHDAQLCVAAGLSIGSYGCNLYNYPSTPQNGAVSGLSDWGAYDSSGWRATWGYNNGIGQYVLGTDNILRYFPGNNQAPQAPGQIISGSCASK